MKPALLCMLGFFLLSSLLHGRADDPINQTIQPVDVTDPDTNKLHAEIKATLKADKTTIPPGGSVTLTCSVDKPAGLTFELFRGSSSTYQTRVSPRSDGVFRITEGGIYTCRGSMTETNFMTTMSDDVTINKRVSNRVSVTSQPNWSLIYRGEKVTLRCEIQDDGGTEWTYEWKPTNRNFSSSSEYMIISATDADSGEYSCKGRRGYEFTGWSEAIRLTVSSDKPRATLTAEMRIIPAGGSVTLTCSVDGSTGWKFDWFENGQYYPVVGSSRNTEPDGTIRVSEGEEYSCRGRRGDSSFESETSEEVTIQKTVSKANVILNPSSSLNEEDNVHLECEIQEEALWTYEWRKNNFNYNPTSRIITADSGNYSCKGTSDYLLTQWSDVITLTISPNKSSLILQSNWSQIYIGEKVTLRCEIQGGTEWTYEWRPTNGNFPSSSEYRIISATHYHSGEYSCRGKRQGFFLTPWSNVVNITVSFPPKPVLSVSPSWPNPGASVTLSCEGLELQSAGWRFFWYKVVPDPSKWYQLHYTYELLPGSTNGTEQNSFIISGPTHTAGYKCRAGRGEPKFYTYYSELNFVWSADPRPAASLSVNPDRVQHFRSDSVSLSCEGNSTEWRVRRIIETDRLLYFACSSWGTMTGSTCTINPYYYMDGVYWCESKSREFSNAVNITAQADYYDGVILVSPVHPVTEGDPVTLSCRDKKQNLLSNVFFYHNNKLINNDSREELNISAVSKSDEGFYKCQHSGKESLRSWMSVRDDDHDVIILVSPVHPVTEGDPVTLSCRDKEQNLLSNVFFYHNNKLINNDSREELNISAVSKSDEGFYKCQHSGKESPRSWMSVRVTVSSPVSSSFPVMLIIGPVVGIVLIILIIVLLLLWRRRRSKDLSSNRLNQPESINPASATNHEVTQNDGSVYSSLLHGDTSLYETIQLSRASGNVSAENIHHPAEESIYANC
ncbi:obscurin-like isoform X2 [Xiphophorus maculatus]|uniref:obscurin-like isoform X2 n=1 Tax=Xiphophorus maculatus TaxID=8083 RepID=UPI000C6DD618|nr:obscurin-like isoform X2 [Xiphophorus maculatus]